MRAPIRINGSGLVLGFGVAAAYFLLGASWPLALGAGLLVYLLKLTLDLPWRAYLRPLPAPEVGSPEAMWLDRRHHAVAPASFCGVQRAVGVLQELGR